MLILFWNMGRKINMKIENIFKYRNVLERRVSEYLTACVCKGRKHILYCAKYTNFCLVIKNKKEEWNLYLLEIIRKSPSLAKEWRKKMTCLRTYDLYCVNLWRDDAKRYTHSVRWISESVGVDWHVWKVWYEARQWMLLWFVQINWI